MRKTLSVLAISATSALGGSCISSQDEGKRPTSSVFTATVSPVTTVIFIGADTLSDSARIHQVEPEPDGRSIAFLFADPGKGITRGLGIVQVSGGQPAHVVWPDSVLSLWWSNAHQLSFSAGTGQGVRLVIDAHAAELTAVDVTGAETSRIQTNAAPSRLSEDALSRAQAFIDSLRIQPGGTPQHSALRYRADSALVAPGDTIGAVHVSAGDHEGNKVNPAWYLVHLRSGHMQAIDSLTGRSPGLAASAGRWGADGSFYYAKERSIWRVQPLVRDTTT